MAYAELIGDPVAHSLSPAIYRHWLEAIGMEGEYRAVRVSPEKLDSYFESRQQDPEWRGCNVTRPLKQAAYLRCDRYGETARSTGAVNLVLRGRDGRLEGGNEDLAGIRGALGGSVRPHMRVAIIGAGGAARAAAVFAASLAPAELWLLCRRREQGLALLGELGIGGGVAPIDPIPEVDLLIQATPALDEWDLGALPSHAVLLDMLYDPPVTPLMAAARARGMIVVGGISMLIHQARGSFAALFGAEPPGADDPRLLERIGR